MSRQARFLCGVPQESCSGGILHTDQQISTKKCHTSRQEAMRCKGRYLMSKGYTRLSSRMYQEPNGGPILILPKRSKFGGQLRAGKGEDGARFEPKRGAGLIF